jgi:phage shock protein E
MSLFLSLLFAILPFAGFADELNDNLIPAAQNPLIDADGFLRNATASLRQRQKRLISEEQFIEMAKDPTAIVLDARSSDRFIQMHVIGAKSLPFTEFTEQSLKELIPSRETRILIYCNNNFLNNTPETLMALTSKSAPASLNLSTYTSLHTYGYKNVFELSPLIDTKTSKLRFQGTLVK